MSDYFVHESSIVDQGASIGQATKVWHFCHIMSSASIGRKCTLGQNVFVGERVKIGNCVKVQNNVSLYEGVICKDDVFLGPSVVFTNVINPRSFVERKTEYQSTIVKKGATIGANATILCGLTIGAYAMIGAGAVITKDVPDYAILVGNPAHQMGWVSKHGDRLTFDKDGMATCGVSGAQYKLQNDLVTEI